MQKRRLGNTELDLTAIGLGTWAIGGSWEWGWGPQDDADSVTTILEAVDCGINWIDTAPIYGCGHCEEVLGKALKEISERPIIATKCGLVWNDKREKANCLDKGSVIAECEASLKRLGIDVIDLYQMHWPEPDERIEEAWEGMADLIKQGKVRFIGASNFNAAQLDRVGKIYPAASLQPPYNMLRRRVEEQLLGYCKDNRLGVVCYSPMLRGLLTGKFDAQKIAQLPPDDHRHKSKEFCEPLLTPNLEFVEALRPIAQRNSRTLAQLAVAWVLRRDEVTSAIVGARRGGQITETAEACDWVLSDEDIAEIDELLVERDTIFSDGRKD